MDDDWWQLCEAESITILACDRKPPKYWEALQHICGQYDVSAEHMYDVDGARRELHEVDYRADFSGGCDEDGYANNEIPQTQDEKTDEDAAPETHVDILVASAKEIKDRSNSRKHQFESSVTTAFQGIADARRATVSAMRPDRYNPEEYAKFKEAFAILNSLPIEKCKPFWKASLKFLKEDAWWCNAFLDTSFDSDEDRIRFLESITELDRLETVTPSNLANFGSVLSGSSGGSVRSSGSSVGHSSGNSLGYSSGNSEYRFAEFSQFQPSYAMEQFFSSPGEGFNMPGQMMGAPYVPMMFSQGFGGYSFITSSPATQMTQTSGSPGVFNVRASSSMGQISARQMGETNQETRTNFSLWLCNAKSTIN
ncbi:hypothetical protein ISN45_Aa04g006730 [Arabidopsis thaliana x Arabidopsis arenosa]|uniref:Uncharacterized protein n=1 Tax=Arabidopsis thaliana x Arabidopsis arenosa TaxID=1240361 RepID=A0A8T2A2S7_9BRAS|nr:hypothetical protein ISN45_Aa04g006730 [Arabidopsis thaliana x Arabidopsis arenosa]